jgi:hypothetical protein
MILQGLHSALKIGISAAVVAAGRLPVNYLNFVLNRYNIPGAMKPFLLPVLLIPAVFITATCAAQPVTTSQAGTGWANNSVNAVIFRKNSLTTWKDTQFIAWYDQDQYMVLGKRRSGDKSWQTMRTAFKGNAADAHNAISIMADGRGYLHVSWDHHNNPLHYVKSIAPGSLEMSASLPMTGLNEARVSYPEFYRLKSGNLLFMYRNGASGNGNLVINRYILKTGKWEQVQTNLIDGENKRNAYCQTAVDRQGAIHISWVWRESPDVASNHDLCYARSADEGLTWQRSDGTKYKLPITESTAEYAFKIPQKSELINQTSMAADDKGVPYIATYWRESGSTIPQYHLVYLSGAGWKAEDLAFRTSPFTLSGAGTKRIPVSRPQVMVTGSGRATKVIMIFRDEERGGRPSMAALTPGRPGSLQLTDLLPENLGSWEPSFDTGLWQDKHILNLFIQRVEQLDGEGKADLPPSSIRVLQWKSN